MNDTDSDSSDSAKGPRKRPGAFLPVIMVIVLIIGFIGGLVLIWAGTEVYSKSEGAGFLAKEMFQFGGWALGLVGAVLVMGSLVAGAARPWRHW